jgi:surface polysaccharide O-acyltransferase-like enzyme
LAHNVPTRLSAAEGRRFAFTVGIAFLALAALLWWRVNIVASALAASVGLLLMLSGALVPHRLGPLHSGWMRFALAISKITTPVLMAIVYFVVITPIGLIRRLMGKSPIMARSGTTRWHSRGAHSRSDLERQF